MDVPPTIFERRKNPKTISNQHKGAILAALPDEGEVSPKLGKIQ